MYKKLRKKGAAFITAICYLAVLFSTCFTVSAEGALSDQMVLDLKAFEILQGDKNGNLNLDRALTRAEMSKLVSAVMGLDEIHYPEDYGVIYNDVPSSHWAFSYITMLSGRGMLNGNPDGNFYPDNPVTYTEAAKILVSMLGFSMEAEANGGYPEGYMSHANRLGVTKGISAGFDDHIIREQALRMIYNSLDADRLVTLYGGSDGSSAEISSKTYRDLLMGELDDGLTEITGVVTANYETYLLDPIHDMEEWQVEIAGILCDKGNTNAEDYLGMEVRAYIRTISAGRCGIVQAIMPVSGNTVLELDVDDIASFTATNFEYYDEKRGKTVKKTIADNARFIYNGRAVDSFEELGFDEIQQGVVKLMADSKNAAFDYVFVNSYESFVVSSVNAEAQRIYLSENDRYLNSRYIEFDDDGFDKILVLLDAEGNEIEAADVQEGDVLTAYASRDENLQKFYISNESVDGTVSALSGNDKVITIGETEYEYEADVAVSELLGENVIARLNYLGKIANIEKELASGNYAAIVGISNQSAFEDDILLRLAIPGSISDEMEETTGDDPSQDKVPAIAAQNRELLEIHCAPKVRINQQSYSGNRIVSVLQEKMISSGRNYLVVSYSTDSSGMVRRIDILEEMLRTPAQLDPSGNPMRVLTAKKKYNAYNKTFGANNNGAFGLGDATLGICIPENTVASSKDYLARIDMNHKRVYTVGAYAYNEDTHCPDVVVFNEPMSYETSGRIDGTSRVAMIAESYITLDEEGETIQGITLMTPDGKLETRVSDHTSKAGELDFEGLRAGDLIYYSLDGKDQLDGFELIASSGSIPEDSFDNTDMNRELFIGTITDIAYKVVADSANEWCDAVTIGGTALAEKVYYIRLISSPPIYVYDSRTEEVSLGTNDDYLTDHQKAIISASYGNVKAIAIIN